MTDIQKAYNFNKIWFHSLPENKNMQLHHVWGRVGIFLCCRQGFIGLTVSEHNSWKVLKQLRYENVGLKMMVMGNYDKTRVYCSERINEKCENCLLDPLTKVK